MPKEIRLCLVKVASISMHSFLCTIKDEFARKVKDKIKRLKSCIAFFSSSINRSSISSHSFVKGFFLFLYFIYIFFLNETIDDQLQLSIFFKLKEAIEDFILSVTTVKQTHQLEVSNSKSSTFFNLLKAAVRALIT